MQPFHWKTNESTSRTLERWIVAGCGRQKLRLLRWNSSWCRENSTSATKRCGRACRQRAVRHDAWGTLASSSWRPWFKCSSDRYVRRTNRDGELLDRAEGTYLTRDIVCDLQREQLDSTPDPTFKIVGGQCPSRTARWMTNSKRSVQALDLNVTLSTERYPLRLVNTVPRAFRPEILDRREIHSIEVGQCLDEPTWNSSRRSTTRYWSAARPETRVDGSSRRSQVRR